MSKRKASNSILIINQVMNDINTWLVDESRDWNEEVDNLNNLREQE